MEMRSAPSKVTRKDSINNIAGLVLMQRPQQYNDKPALPVSIYPFIKYACICTSVNLHITN